MQVQQALFDMIAPIVEDEGLALWTLSWRAQQKGPNVLQIMVEQADGQPADIDACARLSRALSVVLDVEAPLHKAYTLEVSSPGMARTLSTPAHFARYIGAKIKCVADLPEGRETLKGSLLRADDDSIAMQHKGQEWVVGLDKVNDAVVMPDYQAALKQQKNGAKNDEQ